MVGVMLELKETKKADIELYWAILDMLNVPLEITNDFKKIEGFLSKINLKYVKEAIKQCKDLQDQFASVGYKDRFINHSNREEYDEGSDATDDVKQPSGK